MADKFISIYIGTYLEFDTRIWKTMLESRCNFLY
jgi:hypothetical protein